MATGATPRAVPLAPPRAARRPALPQPPAAPGADSSGQRIEPRFRAGAAADTAAAVSGQSLRRCHRAGRGGARAHPGERRGENAENNARENPGTATASQLRRERPAVHRGTRQAHPAHPGAPGAAPSATQEGGTGPHTPAAARATAGSAAQHAHPRRRAPTPRPLSPQPCSPLPPAAAAATVLPRAESAWRRAGVGTLLRPARKPAAPPPARRARRA